MMVTIELFILFSDKVSAKHYIVKKFRSYFEIQFTLISYYGRKYSFLINKY